MSGSNGRPSNNGRKSGPDERESITCSTYYLQTRFNAGPISPRKVHDYLKGSRRRGKRISVPLDRPGVLALGLRCIHMLANEWDGQAKLVFEPKSTEAGTSFSSGRLVAGRARSRTRNPIPPQPELIELSREIQKMVRAEHKRRRTKRR